MISSCFSSFTLHRFQYSRLKNRHASGEHFLHGTTNQSTPWLTRSTLFRMTVRYKPPFSLQVSSTLKSISEHRTVLGHGLPQLFCWDNGLFRHYEDALPGLAIQSRNERKQRGRRQRRISPLLLSFKYAGSVHMPENQCSRRRAKKLFTIGYRNDIEQGIVVGVLLVFLVAWWRGW